MIFIYRLFILFLLLCIFLKLPNRLEAQSSIKELRGVWVTNVASTVMNSKSQIAEAMDSISVWSINAIIPVMLNNGYTLYPSSEMDYVSGSFVYPAFEGRDILAKMIAEAHRVGIEVHVLLEYGFYASFAANGGPILQSNPGWAGKRYQTETAEDDYSFVWMSQANAEVQQFLINLGLEIAENYDIDGNQLDRVWYGNKLGNDGWPVASDFGYDEAHLQRYRDENDGAEMPDTWIPTNSQFKNWRSKILDEFHLDFFQQVKEVNSNIKISNTTVSFRVGANNGSPEQVDLSIYNSVGQKIETIVKGTQRPGN